MHSRDDDALIVAHAVRAAGVDATIGLFPSVDMPALAAHWTGLTFTLAEAYDLHLVEPAASRLPFSVLRDGLITVATDELIPAMRQELPPALTISTRALTAVGNGLYLWRYGYLLASLYQTLDSGQSIDLAAQHWPISTLFGAPDAGELLAFADACRQTACPPILHPFLSMC